MRNTGSFLHPGALTYRVASICGFLVGAVLALSLFAAIAVAQSTSSSISGTVTDPTGAVIVGAKVNLTLTLTGAVRTATTNASGNFVFLNVPAGTYELQITQTGFKTYDQKNISLGVQENLPLHNIALQVGATSTSVTVSAQAARVQTSTMNSSGLVSESQISNIPNKGRNFMDYLTLLPGINGPAGGTNAPGWSSGNIYVNGGDSGQVLTYLNGVASEDAGSLRSVGMTQPSPDSISEERVHTGVEDAQYGGRAGGSIDIVTKNGTSHFHGDVYYFNRNNFYNANDYFRKENHNPAISDHPAPYKYNDVGGTIGGPILLPGLKYNSTRQRAFFFFSYEGIWRTTSGNLRNMTTPTPAERGGVFTNLTQNLVNPSGNAAQQPTCSGTNPDITCTFPGAAFDTAGHTLLNALPMPTCLRAGDSPTGLNASLAGLPACSNNTHNYNYVNTYPNPWHNDVLRTDFKLSNSESFYVVLQTNREERKGYTGFLGGSANWPQSLTDYLIRSRDAMGSLTSIISPTVVNVITAGTTYDIQSDFATNAQALSSNNRAALGLGPTVLPVLFPDAANGGAQSPQVNPFDLIPNVSFGGQTNENSLVGGNNKAGAGTMPHAPDFRFESRYPFFGPIWDWTVTDDLSWVTGNHSLKFGLFFEHVSRTNADFTNVGGQGFNGVLNLNSHGIFNAAKNSSGSPFDTGNPFANAIVGAFNSYGEVNSRVNAHDVNHDFAWYAQDDWKVTRRLTLDLGMRFTIMSPDRLRNNQLVSQFQPSLYNADHQPGLIFPCTDTSTGGRVGCESTGAYVPASTIGLYDPTTYNGSVPPYSGMIVTPGYIYFPPHIGLGPRIGFALDVFGNGNTAIRGGFGMFYDRTSAVGDVLKKAVEPPLIMSPAVYNSTIPQMLASPTSQTFIGPQTVHGDQQRYSMPQVYNYTLGVEQNLTHGILLDVKYVGNVSRHYQRTYQYNNLPYGELFQSQYQDPTHTGAPYITNLVRCLDSSLYCGYSGVQFSQFDENANYNALQTSVTKRFGANFIGGASYTWSKVLDYGGCCDTHSTPYLPGGARYFYGPASQNVPQNLTVNWHYNLPNSPFQNRLAKEGLNGWSVEGIASFISGQPGVIHASYAGDPNGGGGPIGAVVSGSVVKSRSSTTQFLNPNALAAAPHGPGVCELNSPALCGLGNSSPKDAFTVPGVNNWNVSLLKKFPLGGSESRYVQFRWETYNTFNHPQFAAPNSGASFGNGTTVANSTYGQITSSLVPARLMVFALKLYF